MLELFGVLGRIARSVACKAIFFGMGWSSALVGNAGAGNVFIQCEQIMSILSRMGCTHTVSWENAGKLEVKGTMTNYGANPVDCTAKH